ncbi:MAG TPA: DUF6325 family protein [Solirubrobacteraceae bacterium]|nr:DUF6325 family protein [Solirubrobacteraceae bacterium]
MDENEVELGPVDIIVIGYPPGAPMTGEAVPIMLDLVDRGIVRILDALFVTKEEDGTFSGIDLANLDAGSGGDLTVFAGASSGLISDDDVAMIAAEIEPGSAALTIVYENRWAGPFAAAVRRNGGRLIASERVSSQDLIDALDAAEAAALS